MNDKVNKLAAGFGLGAALVLALLLPNDAAFAADSDESATIRAPRAGYAWMADLVTDAAAIAVVQVTQTFALPPERAPGLAPGERRLLVQVQTMSLIRSNDVLAREASFVMDVTDTGEKKAPDWKGRKLIIFGQVQDRVDFFQLLSSAAVIAWSPENEARARQIAADFSAADAPPIIKAVNSVFHVGGAVAGAGETQVFLDTVDGDPISLSIVHRPDEAPQFGASLGEIVDDAAALPAVNTPLWYRLACSLPASLPAKALAGQAPADAAAASKDYAAFLAALAPCDPEPTPLS